MESKFAIMIVIKINEKILNILSAIADCRQQHLLIKSIKSVLSHLLYSIWFKSNSSLFSLGLDYYYLHFSIKNMLSNMEI